ncbi:cytochrome P450 [Streptomyces sp. YIM 98790]|uniref:cytochrome P450 n=1 Tax=Streptomyces sp. YIM 98790 TaxID=2689077 RepID=UPI00140994D9|nr:cytochrome P450 [Streptomyces sp. YIM 98790]
MTAPAAGGPAPEPLYTEEFAADPGAVYARLRKHGPAAPVELAPGVRATMVTGYAEALYVLRSPELFVKDSRRWPELRDGTVPPAGPVALTLAHKPHCYLSDGQEHLRLRQTISDALDGVDSATLRSVVEEVAGGLADALRRQAWDGPAGGPGDGHGGRADLLADYAVPLCALVFNRISGCPPAHAERLQEAATTLAVAYRSGDPAAARDAWQDLLAATRELVAHKRRHPGDDLLSRMADHPAGLTDSELAHQYLLVASFAVPPQHNLIVAVLRLLLAGDGFGGDLSGGSLPVEDAIDEVLWTHPPLANRGVYFPVRDTLLGDTVLPAWRPVVVSFAAANADLAPDPERRRGSRAHLAWGAGPHTCPARGHARLIATVAVETLLDRLPDLRPAVPAEELRWLPGPFFRALQALPVTGIPPAPAPTAAPSPGPGPHPGPDPGTAGPPGPGGTAAEAAADPVGTRAAAARRPSALARMQAAFAQWWRGE